MKRVYIGETLLENASVKLSSDGMTLMLTCRKPSVTLAKLAAMLGDSPVITVKDGITTVGVYQGMKMTSLVMETIGGALEVNAMLTVQREAAGDAQMSEQIAQAQKTAEAALAAVTAIEEGVAYV